MINVLLITRRNFVKKHLPNKLCLYVYLVEYSFMGATLGMRKMQFCQRCLDAFPSIRALKAHERACKRLHPYICNHCHRGLKRKKSDSRTSRQGVPLTVHLFFVSVTISKCCAAHAPSGDSTPRRGASG